MAKTKIEWTDETWNLVTGCSKISEGCRNCYAERIDRRFQTNHPGLEWLPWTKQNAGQNVRLHPERLEQPLHWQKPRRVFVCSMGDLFHDQVPDEFIAKVFGIMQSAPQHIFQVLTKRAKPMMEWIDWFSNEWLDRGAYQSQYGHVWLGISAEDQPTFDKRVALLLQTPAAARFVSLEPLLGPIDMSHVVRHIRADLRGNEVVWDEKSLLDWVIVGGESGPGARPMHPDWVRSIRDQCQAAGVPFFFKQWGAWAPCADVIDVVDGPDISTKSKRWYELPPGQGSAGMCRVGKKRAGSELEGRTWEEVPNM